MDAQDFEQSNMILSAGKNKHCNDLIAGHAMDRDGYTVVVAKFKLSPEELQRINETGELWLSNRGGWPPVLPTVWHPYEELGYVPLNQG